MHHGLAENGDARTATTAAARSPYTSDAVFLEYQHPISSFLGCYTWVRRKFLYWIKKILFWSRLKFLSRIKKNIFKASDEFLAWVLKNQAHILGQG